MLTTRRLGSTLLQRASSSDRRIWFRLVTRDVDRHGTIIEPAGVDMHAFMANPVFLWMHDSGGEEKPTPHPETVIGRVVNFEQSVDALDIEVEFDDDGDGLAATCFRKVKDGFLRMVSIGCNVLEDSVVELDGVKIPVYTKTELLEASLVIVGSNRAALKLDRAAVVKLLREGQPEDRQVVSEGGAGGERTVSGGPIENASATREKLSDHVASIAVFAPLSHIDIGKVEVEGQPSSASSSDMGGALGEIEDDLDGDEWLEAHEQERLGMLWGKRRDCGLWTTPGGRFLPGEDSLTAACRELYEETGIKADAKDLKPLGIHHLENGLTIHAYRLDLPIAAQPDVTRDPDQEVAEWQWTPITDGTLPESILAALHAPKNVLVDVLGLSRSVAGAGGPSVDFLLSSTVEGFDDAEGRKVIMPQASGSDDSADDLFEQDHHEGLVVKLGDASQTRAVVPFKSYPVVQGKWDADAAVKRWRKWASKDGSGKLESMDWYKYAQCFCWYDADNKETFGAYKLPHHDIQGGKPVTVWQGVVAAAAAISGARGGVKGLSTADETKIKAHLAKHYKEFDKVPPWQVVRVAKVEMPAIISAPSNKITQGPIQALELDEDGQPYVMQTVMVQCLKFPINKYTLADALVWAEEHGFIASGAVEKDGYIKIVQLRPGLFKPNGLGQGIKFREIEYPNGIIAIVGVLRGYGYRNFDSTIDASTKAELRLALVKMARPKTMGFAERLQRTNSLLEKGWAAPELYYLAHGSAAGKRAVDRLRTSLRAQHKDLVWRMCDFDAVVGTLSSLCSHVERSYNSPYYLTHKTQVQRVTPMRKSPEGVQLYRGLVQHALEHAAMHTDALRGDLVSDECRVMHLAHAMRALDMAEETHSAMRAAMSDEPDGDEGMLFRAPEIQDAAPEMAELRTRFADVVAKVGKLPQTLRSVVQAELGTLDVALIEEKLMSLKSDREQMIGLKRNAKLNQAAIESAEVAKLIEDAEAERLITPADVKKMRGLNPATETREGNPWPKTRVARYIEERRASGPVAEIVRPGQERVIQPTAPSSPKPGLFRFGGSVPQSGTMSESDRQATLRSFAAAAGIKDPDSILSKVDAAVAAVKPM